MRGRGRRFFAVGLLLKFFTCVAGTFSVKKQRRCFSKDKNEDEDDDREGDKRDRFDEVFCEELTEPKAFSQQRFLTLSIRVSHTGRLRHSDRFSHSNPIEIK